jgi:hypothetical protein
MKASLDSSLLTVMMTLNDVEIGNFFFDAAAHYLGNSHVVVKNPAKSREGTEVDLFHYFCLRVMMTWTDVEIETQHVDKGMCCAGAGVRS